MKNGTFTLMAFLGLHLSLGGLGFDSDSLSMFSLGFTIANISILFTDWLFENYEKEIEKRAIKNIGKEKRK